MPDPIEDSLSRAALWGGNPPLGDTKGLASLAQYAAERNKANAMVNAAEITARAHLEGAQAAAGAHERGMTGAANIQAAARERELAGQQETSLANAATARYGHEEGIKLDTAARERLTALDQAAKDKSKAKSGYISGAPGIFGVESAKEMTPTQQQLYQEHIGNLPALQNAWEREQWWGTHGTPENISGFIEHAKAQGRPFSPEKEADFRAKAQGRSPDVRSIYGPAMEEYSGSQPSSWAGRRIQETGALAKDIFQQPPVVTP